MKGRTSSTTVAALAVAVSNLIIAPAGKAHPSQTPPPDHPVVASFDRFFAAQADEAKLAQGGLLLLTEMNCVSCHAVPDAWKGQVPQRGKIALDGVGSRLDEEAIAGFVKSPHEKKPGTLMPGMFAGEADSKAVEAITAYLSSLKKAPKEFPKGDAEKGKELYHTVGCVACHSPAAAAEYKPIEAAPGTEVPKPTQASVPITLAESYDTNALAAFLKDPLATRKHGRMPSTQMTDEEAANLAAYLQMNRKPGAQAGKAKDAPDAKVAVEEGRKQFLAQRCIACHDVGAKDRSQLAPVIDSPAPALAALQAGKGCLSDTKKAGVPDYGLSAAQKQALVLGLKLVQSTAQPQKQSAVAKSEAFLMRMNCYGCHEWHGQGGLEEPRGQYFTVIEPSAHSLGEIGRLPPKLDAAGRKLTQGWMEKLLWGQDGGVRTYMTARMPRFGKANSAAFIPAFAEAGKRQVPVEIDTSGLAKHHRAENGRILIGVGKGGLGCVSCHGLKDRKSLGVPVVNLTHTVERLQPEYFKELLLNPQATQPGTLMPPLFMGRKAADKEIEMLWTYLKEIDQSRLPEGLLQTGDYELKPEVEKKPIVFRTFMEGAGTEAIAAGYPQQLHVAFDSYEVRWALAWKGRFLDAMTTWEERAMTPAKPLGDKVLTLPLHVSLAKLGSQSDPWPESYGMAAGYFFKGYRMGTDKAPVFLYEVGGLKVEDSLRPTPDGKGLKRTCTIRGSGEGWYFLGLAQDARATPIQWKDGVAVLEETISL